MTTGTVEESKDLDDGPFERLLKQARRVSTDPSEVKNWLTRQIVHKFVGSYIRDKDHLCYQIEEEEEEENNKARNKKIKIKNESSNSQCHDKSPEEHHIEEEQERARKKMKKKKKKIKKSCIIKSVKKQLDPYPAPELPAEFMERIKEMDGCDVVLVMQKLLTPTDASKTHVRLSIPISQIRNQFLTEEESNCIANKEEMKVSLIEPCLEVSEQRLKMWDMSTTGIYVLLSNWLDVLSREDNGLNVVRGEVTVTVRVQLWAFRAGPKRELCFALVNLGRVNVRSKNKKDGNGNGYGNGASTSSSNANGNGNANGSSTSRSPSFNGDEGPSTSLSSNNTLIHSQEQGLPN